MPFDAFGWSPTNATGYGGRQVGDYFGGSYFNPDTGRLQGTPYVSQQVQSVAPGAKPYVQGQPFAPPAQNDFFAQLASLVGGGAPQNLQQGNQLNPWSQMQQMSVWRPGQAVNAGNVQSFVSSQVPNMAPTTYGGQGKYGGVSKEGQQQMFGNSGQVYAGQQPAYGKVGSTRNNPLSNLPYGGGNGVFRRGGGGAL